MKTKDLVMLIVLLSGFLSAAQGSTPGNNGDYVYQSKNLNVQITMPGEWQDKVRAIETDQSVTFSYTNPGGQPVFLYSITKIPEQTWMNIKEQLINVHVITEKNGTVYFVETTDKTSIKGNNAKEFKSIVNHLGDILHNIQVN
jgi:hypothetical protein